MLLAHGADPMLRGSYYLVSAVTVAAMGCTEYVPMLLEHVADDLDLYTACAIADHERVARILAESPEAATQADADSRDGSWLPLQYCARCKAGSDENRLATATLLLEHGADPATALDQACWADNGAIADLLLERGARLSDDDTPNHLACDGQFDILESLLRHGAIDMNGTRGTGHHGGYNPLGCAVNMRSLQGVTWFLDHGCDPNEVMSRTGETALHVAVSSGAGVPLARLLVERGVGRRTPGRRRTDRPRPSPHPRNEPSWSSSWLSGKLSLPRKSGSTVRRSKRRRTGTGGQDRLTYAGWTSSSSSRS